MKKTIILALAIVLAGNRPPAEMLGPFPAKIVRQEVKEQDLAEQKPPPGDHAGRTR